MTIVRLYFLALTLILSTFCPKGSIFSHAFSNVRGNNLRPLVQSSSRVSNRVTTGTNTGIGIDLQMCICINCARVTNCKAYHFVEEQHEQPHMNDDPTFEPVNGSPTMHVTSRVFKTEEQATEADLMWKNHATEQEKLEDDAKKRGQDPEVETLVGGTKYNFAPIIEIEYDVVACADYLHSPGSWVRHMPEEIRTMNPDFVPS